MKKIIFICALAVLSLTGMAQQRPITSTYPYNGLLINPAYAGSLNLLSVIGVHRKQWVNVDGAPTFTALSAHSSFVSNRVGAGFFTSRDETGPTVDYALYGSYAYKIKTPVGILSMGLSGGFNSRTTDFGKLDLLDPNDPYLSGTDRRFAPNFGTGVYLANPIYYIGFSVPYILENKTVDLTEITNTDNESRESRYYYLTGGFIFDISTHVKLSPGFLLRAQESSRIGWDVNANVIFDGVAYVGVNMRNSGDLTFFGQVILNENMRIGYAYDATTSDLNNQSAGSHEVLVNYRIKLKNYRKDPQCPVYF